MIQTDFFRFGGAPPRMLELLSSMHASDPDRWIPRRLILQNYWLFEEPEIFHFARGNLMLTGQNESGKSTVMVTAITLVLDMMLAPDRVDTMGSGDRSIRYYLVGKDDATEDSPYYHRERTAYIVLEFERGATGRYLSLGLGLRSSRDWANQKVERWGFVMPGPRRIELDVQLYDGIEQRRPLRPGELRDRLGAAGQVFDDQRAYKAAVNDALFGFQTVDEYERMLEMLHVVRTPKLGEGLNPKKVEAYLKESLPPIQATAIESASDVFSKLDTIEAELERIRGQTQAADDLVEPQEAAVLAAARHAAAEYREAAREHRTRSRKYETLVAELTSARTEVANNRSVREQLASDRADHEGRLRILEEQYQQHGAFDLEKRLDDVRGEHRDAEEAAARLLTDRERAGISREGVLGELREAEVAWQRQRDRLAEKLVALAKHARDSFWPALERRAVLAGDALVGLTADSTGPIAADLARSAVTAEAKERSTIIAGMLAAIDLLGTANGRLGEARKASEVASREFNQSDERYRGAAREADLARISAMTALEDWRRGCIELQVSEQTVEAVHSALRSYEPANRRPTVVLEPFEPIHEQARDALGHALREVELQHHEMNGEVEKEEQRLARLVSEPDVEPDRTEAQEIARRLLTEHAVPHIPLYEACDLAGPLAEDTALAARVEAALADAGLLDALIVPTASIERVRKLLDEHGLSDRWIQPKGQPDQPPDSMPLAASNRSSEHRDADPPTNTVFGRGSLEREPWLTPIEVPEVESADVRAALATLGLGENASLIERNGRWRLGPIEGISAAHPEGRVRFLGEPARRVERQRRIDAARQRLIELRGSLAILTDQIEAMRDRQRTLAKEWQSVHELDALQSVHDQLRALQHVERERENRRGIAEMAAEAVENATREVQRLAAALSRVTDSAPYLRDRPRDHVQAVAVALEYSITLTDEIGEHVEWMDETRRMCASRKLAAESLLDQVEELTPRISSADARVRTLGASLSALEELLTGARIGRDEVSAQLGELKGRLRRIAEADNAARSVIDKNLGIVQTLSSQEGDHADQLRSALIHLQEEEVNFSSRLSAYPSLQEFLDLMRGGAPDAAMQRILHGAEMESLEDDLKRTQDALQVAFFRAVSAFEEMSPSLDRGIVRFTHPDGPMRLHELCEILDEERRRKEALLEAEDRRLIEQLMLREVVDAIRAAIAQTRRWVGDVNHILGGMNLFKDGVMRLHWEVRSRETADAYDPKRLDDLLSQRGIALDESRREELLNIFRSMVSDVRRRNREKELYEDYRTALLRMVDYTQWYSLTVQRKDEAGRWIPLTRRLYGQGSGGRRTLDLLLPLIAAVSARLSSADHGAPRLIGFDEAFAGVDDRNATEIYRLLAEMEFNWIMASEKTTAVGAHIRGSATYELLTDGATVAPTLSLWDGERSFEFVGDELLAVKIPSPVIQADAR